MGLGDLNPVRIVEGKGAIGESGLGGLVIGAGLAAMGIPPGMAALYTGGASALLTGDLKQGLFMGMGAYGGAGLMGGLEGLGEKELAEKELGKTALSGTDLASDQALAANQAANAEAIAADPLQSMNQTQATSQATPINAAQTGQTVQTTTPAPGLEGVNQRLTNAGAGIDRLTSSGGIDALSKQMAANAANPAIGGPASLMGAAGWAGAGALGTYKQPNPAVGAAQKPGYIRQFTYDPYGQRYNALTPVQADQWGSRSFQDAFKAADGGIVALAHGGAVQHFDNGGAAAVAATPQYTASQINDYIAKNNLSGDALTAAEKQFGVSHDQVTAAQNAQNTVQNVYENVLGRNADPNGLAYWTNQITSGTVKPEDMYKNFLNSAQANHELGNFGLTLNQATSPYTGYASSDTRGIVDEWTQNVLGRGLTEEDKQQNWYKQATDANVMNTYDVAQNIYGDFQKYAKEVGAKSVAEKAALARQTIAAKGLTDADVYAQTGKTIEQLIGAPKTDLDIFHASQLLAPTDSAFDFASLKPNTAMPGVTPGGKYGKTTDDASTTTPGDIVTNEDGTRTVGPNLPGGGNFTGVSDVKDRYTAGGGSLGYTPYVPKTAAEHDATYNTMTGGSKAAFDYLMGKTKYSSVPYTPTGEIMKPYAESVLGVPADNTRFAQRFNPTTRKYEANPDYKPFVFNQDTGQTTRGMNTSELREFVADPNNLKTPSAESPGFLGDLVKQLNEGLLDRPVWMAQNNISYERLASALGISVAEAKKRYPVKEKTAATGGLMGLAGGGLGTLGGYSDGGRLLKGPGDGVSDSIPASIGDKQPARLADGEFVVPARIVSELGNGSTDAGARKLYAMMDRVQKARGKTTGKGKVATNSRADKYLPV